MPHTLIVGMTGSGKSTLAHRLSAEYRKAGVGVIVLDIVRSSDWAADFQTSDPDEFLRVFWRSRSCAAFIDESGATFRKFDRALLATATMGRHWGHNVHYLTQAAKQLNPVIRAQCERLIMFTSRAEDADEMAKDFGQAELREASRLPRFTYLETGRFSPVNRGSTDINHVKEKQP